MIKRVVLIILFIFIFSNIFYVADGAITTSKSTILGTTFAYEVQIPNHLQVGEEAIFETILNVHNFGPSINFLSNLIIYLQIESAVSSNIDPFVLNSYTRDTMYTETNFDFTFKFELPERFTDQIQISVRSEFEENDGISAGPFSDNYNFITKLSVEPHTIGSGNEINLFTRIISTIILLGVAGFLVYQSRRQYLQHDKYDKLRFVITGIIFVHLFITKSNLRFTDVTAILFLTFFLLSFRILLQTLTTMNEMRGSDQSIVNDEQANEIRSKYQEQRVISSLVSRKNI